MSVLSALAAAHDVAAAECKLARIDEWTVLGDRGSPVLEGAINGRKVPVLIDTGMMAREGALLERSLARRLGVPLFEDPGRTMVGGGGESQVHIGLIREIRIGQATRRDWQVLVSGEDHGGAGFFIIGNSFFRDTEVEFDLGRRAIRLFKSRDCKDVSLAYWTASAGVLPVETEGGIALDVLVNGKPVRAIIDTGASVSLMDTAVLARIGAASQLPTAAAGPCLRGIGKQPVETQAGEFDTFAIGDEMIRNPKIYFADLHKDVTFSFLGLFKVRKHELPEMILGADFLHAHRVLVARSQGRMFFTYEGGPVFPPNPAAPCLKGAVKPEQRERGGEKGQ